MARRNVYYSPLYFQNDLRSWRSVIAEDSFYHRNRQLEKWFIDRRAHMNTRLNCYDIEQKGLKGAKIVQWYTEAWRIRETSKCIEEKLENRKWIKSKSSGQTGRTGSGTQML